MDDYAVTLTGSDHVSKLNPLMDALYKLNYEVYQSLAKTSSRELLACTVIDPRINTLKSVGKTLENFLDNALKHQIEPDLHSQLALLAGKFIKKDPSILVAQCINTAVVMKLGKGHRLSPLAASNLMYSLNDQEPCSIKTFSNTEKIITGRSKYQFLAELLSESILVTDWRGSLILQHSTILKKSS